MPALGGRPAGPPPRALLSRLPTSCPIPAGPHPSPAPPPAPQDGRQFAVRVDEQQPSRLLLQDLRSKQVFALQTRVDRVNINNAAAMGVLFGGDAWLAQLQRVR